MHNELNKEAYYQIVVKGSLDERWAGWIHEMQVITELDNDGSPITVLTGNLIDQVALRGLTNMIWDLNMEVISINKIENNA